MLQPEFGIASIVSKEVCDQIHQGIQFHQRPIRCENFNWIYTGDSSDYKSASILLQVIRWIYERSFPWWDQIQYTWVFLFTQRFGMLLWYICILWSGPFLICIIKLSNSWYNILYRFSGQWAGHTWMISKLPCLACNSAMCGANLTTGCINNCGEWPGVGEAGCYGLSGGCSNLWEDEQHNTECFRLCIIFWD